MKTLVLCRHAKSDWPSGVADIDRPLKDRGIMDAHNLGSLLEAHDFQADLIVSSPGNRAHSTAKLVAQHIKYPEKEIKIDNSVYYEGANNLMNVIEELPNSADTVMIFGHNPTMEQAVRYLLKMESPFSMPTLGMVCMEGFTQDWKKFRQQYVYLRWIQIPRLQRKED
jgi:phosphohistidine phosphatase